MAVRAPCVHVEKVGEVKFPDTKFDPPRREGCSEIKFVAIGFDALGAKRNYLAQHQPRDVGNLAESRVSHDVEIGDAGQAEGVAETMAASAFHVEKHLGSGREFIAEV